MAGLGERASGVSGGLGSAVVCVRGPCPWGQGSVSRAQGAQRVAMARPGPHHPRAHPHTHAHAHAGPSAHAHCRICRARLVTPEACTKRSQRLTTYGLGARNVGAGPSKELCLSWAAGQRPQVRRRAGSRRPRHRTFLQGPWAGRPTSQSPPGTQKATPRLTAPRYCQAGPPRCPSWEDTAALALPPRSRLEPGPLSAWQPGLPPRARDGHGHLPAPVTLMRLLDVGSCAGLAGGSGCQRGPWAQPLSGPCTGKLVWTALCLAPLTRATALCRGLGPVPWGVGPPVWVSPLGRPSPQTAAS